MAGAQTAYLLYASDNNQNFKISRLDTNYYNVTTQVSVMSGAYVLHISAFGPDRSLSLWRMTTLAVHAHRDTSAYERAYSSPFPY